MKIVRAMFAGLSMIALLVFAAALSYVPPAEEPSEERLQRMREAGL